MWKDSGANQRFAVYFFKNNSEVSWANMTHVRDKIYVVEIDKNADSVIFCRMNGANGDNTWDNVWNQSHDLNFSNQLGKTYRIDSWETWEWDTKISEKSAGHWY